MKKIVYQPQYRGEHTETWYASGHPVDEDTALRLVEGKLSEYMGMYPTRRVLRVTTEELIIENEIKFKETK